MPVVPAKELLAHARNNNYAVGYFEAWDMQSLEAVLAAAEAERSPVILGFGLMTADLSWAGDRIIHYFAGLANAAGQASHVPVSLILNESRSLEQAKLGIELGFNIAMLEGSADLGGLGVIEGQKELIRLAHSKGVAVEAEIGELPWIGEMEEGSLTNPSDAAKFVAETGVDILAVSVGNVHCGTEGASTVDLERLEAIGRAVPAPLSLHGGSGLPADCIPGAIAASVAKVNVGTVLKEVYRNALVGACSAPAKLSDVQKCIGSGGYDDVLAIAARAVKDKVREFMRIYGSSGKAWEV